MERTIPTIGVPAGACSRRAPSPGAWIAAAVIAVSCLWPWSVAARPMAMVDSYPMVDQIMDGDATAFALRFDAPVDHAGARLILLTTSARVSYLDHAFRPDDVLLFGRESAGVPERVHEAADVRLVIPMREGLRSLNVAMAVAMVVGEAMRQVTFSGERTGSQP